MMKAITKMVPKQFVEIDDVTVPYDDLCELLDALEGTDGMFTAVTIYSDKLAKLVEDRGIASKNVRGSHSCKDEKKREALLNELRELEFES